MALLKCKMCGGDVELAADKTFGTCEYCGNTMTFPKVEDDQRAAAFNRGNHFRRIGEFDKALAVYERIVREDENDAEAHWCCALCRFGIEYVEDPATFEWLPTCHRASFDSFLEDVDYLAALEHSDGITRRQYQKDAAKIAEVQRGILAASQNAEPYDVFICYKESDEQGNRTRDSLMAQDIYYQLTEQGRRVFFARITLEDVAGAQYEPYIFAALNSAKVMIVVGTKPEYLNAVWVKNEWSRFLAMMKKDRSKLLLPCYRDMDPYDLPEQLSVLQSYDMSKIGFIQDLTRGIAKVLDAEKKPEPVKETVVVQQASATPSAPLLQRAFMFLEDEEWDAADEYCEKVLDMEPKNAQAYLCKLLAELGLTTQADLENEEESFENNKNYQKAIRYADVTLKNTLEGYLTAFKKNLARKEKERLARLERERIARLEQQEREREQERQRKAQETQRLKEAEKRLEPIRQRLKGLEGIIAVGNYHTVGLKSDGTVVATGNNDYGQCNVSNIDGVISVYASGSITVCLKADGTVVACGNNRRGQCNVREWTDVVALAVNFDYVAGLKRDGTVVATGDNGYGQCNVSQWRDIVAIRASSRHLVGLKSDGTVVAAGKNDEGQCDVDTWTNIKDIVVTAEETIGLCLDGTAISTKSTQLQNNDKWTHLVAIATDGVSTVGLRADGEIVGEYNDWRNVLSLSTGYGFAAVSEKGTALFNRRALQKFNAEEKNKVTQWKNIVALCVGFNYMVGLKQDGTVTAAGVNQDGQCNVDSWKLFESLDALEQERQAAEELRLAKLKQAEEMHQRRAAGLCQHCGGTFKGLFGKKCADCGKPKDY